MLNLCCHYFKDMIRSNQIQLVFYIISNVFPNSKNGLKRNFTLTIDRRLKLNELADSILQSSKKGKGSSSSVIMYRVIEKDNCILEPQLVDCCLNNCTKYIKYW